MLVSQRNDDLHRCPSILEELIGAAVCLLFGHRPAQVSPHQGNSLARPLFFFLSSPSLLCSLPLGSSLYFPPCSLELCAIRNFKQEQTNFQVSLRGSLPPFEVGDVGGGFTFTGRKLMQ